MTLTVNEMRILFVALIEAYGVPTVLSTMADALGQTSDALPAREIKQAGVLVAASRRVQQVANDTAKWLGYPGDL